MEFVRNWKISNNILGKRPDRENIVSQANVECVFRVLHDIIVHIFGIFEVSVVLWAAIVKRSINPELGLENQGCFGNLGTSI